MSDELAAYVRYLKLGHAEKEILRNLCLIAGDIPGKLIGIDCHASLEWLSWSSDYSIRQSRYSLRKLEGMQILVPIRVHPEFGTTDFEIHLYRAPKKPPFVSKKRRGPGRDFSKIKGAMVAPYPAESAPHGGQPLPPTQQDLPPMGGNDCRPREAAIAPYPATIAPDFVFVSPVEEHPPTPLAGSEGGQPRERKLTRRERRLKQEMSVAPFEIRTFATAICELCSPGHEWILSEPETATVQPRLACPEFRSRLKGVS